MKTLNNIWNWFVGLFQAPAESENIPKAEEVEAEVNAPKNG